MIFPVSFQDTLDGCGTDNLIEKMIDGSDVREMDRNRFSERG